MKLKLKIFVSLKMSKMSKFNKFKNKLSRKIIEEVFLKPKQYAFRTNKKKKKK